MEDTVCCPVCDRIFIVDEDELDEYGFTGCPECYYEDEIEKFPVFKFFPLYQ